MVLDKILFDKLPVFSDNLCQQFQISKPKDRNTLVAYLEQLTQAINIGEQNSMFIGLILYDFISSKETRDRHTTARIFEDIFGGLIGVVATDTESRMNPPVPDYIKKYDTQIHSTGWTVSGDLSKNKREKADHKIGEYNLSLKTLKGLLYDANGTVINKKFNDEINIGSFSHRALFTGLTKRTLSDRKGGLGSSKQIIPLLYEIKNNGYFEELKNRIHDYVKYIYSDDMVIVFKSGYKMQIIIIPAETFVTAIYQTLDDEEKGIEKFTKIWYRWENNNLRINFIPLMKTIKELKLTYYSTTLNLEKVFENKQFVNNIMLIEKLINEKIEDLL